MKLPRSPTDRGGASAAFVFFVILLDAFGVGVAVPVMPRLMASFAHGDLGKTSSYLAAFWSLYSAAQVVCAPLLGALSDRFGRRPVLLISLLGGAIDCLCLAVSPSVAWLMVARFVAGVTGANFSAASAYIADVTPAENRAKAFGLLGVAFSVGIVLGPIAGGFVGGHNPRAPFFLTAFITAANLTYGFFVLPESLPPERRRAFSFARANPFGAIRGLVSRGPLLRLMIAHVCVALAQHCMYSIYVLYTQERFGWRPRAVGIVMTLVGVSRALVLGTLVAIVVRRLGEVRTMTFGMFLSVGVYLAFGAATHGWMFYALIVPYAISALVNPTLRALLSKQVGPSQQGELQGAASSLESLAAMASPLISLPLFARFGAPAAVPYVPGAPFFAAASFSAVALVIASSATTRSRS